MSGPVLPWDWSYPADGDESLVPNLPTAEGAQAGAELSQIAEEGKANLERQGLACGKRCDDCAYTLGTVPNRSLSTVGDALKAAVEGVPFHCHKGAEPGVRLCGGWLDTVAHPSLSGRDS